ncbi:hypothetical protein BKA62DRAFT_22797 [Auriculariales sp. MPI-PUGE-AT-0066]|nr:hypothetical protein BKA62DRAFT_22797 [Auriculariales sp. MPI-PUGE-AT-0066]
MESAVDSPAIALFNQPGQQHQQHQLKSSPSHFIARSLHNIRQGNIALFVVFCGCFIIFSRALFGVGYDEGHSAQADAASAKHPSLLSRWSGSQHALEEQWNKLRDRGSGDGHAGLWAKIKKEDETSTTARPHVPGADALHWLRVMEDRALEGLGRKRVHIDDQSGQIHIALPEHDISEDLDAHDAHDGDDDNDEEEHKVARKFGRPDRDPKPAAPVAVAVAPEDAAAAEQHPSSAEPEPVVTTPSDPAPPAASPSPTSQADAPRDTSQSTHHDDTSKEDPDDEPVYHRDEHR